MVKLSRVAPLSDRIHQLEILLSKSIPVPKDWLNKPGELKDDAQLKIIPCDNYKELIQAWRKAMKWTPGLDCALSVMLASVVSTKALGDQLWVKIMGPGSCGKSKLCEALSVNKEFVVSKDTFTGLSSGYQSDNEGSENLSLVTKIKDKTLIINDGDTLLKLPNLTQVLSQLRAFYGRNLRTSFKNKMSADHEGYNTTIILCGTSSLRKLDESELGERFLSCVIMEGIDNELEDEILLRVANKANQIMAMESDGDPEKQDDPTYTYAKKLTGGYVEYLRHNAQDLFSKVDNPELAIRKCTRLGKFAAFMRARPSYQQDEVTEREFAPRLVSTHIRLSIGLAVVMQRKKVDEVVMRRVKKVALDTSRGVVLNICEYLYGLEKGSTAKAVSTHTGISEGKANSLLKFMRKIDAVKLIKHKRKGRTSSLSWCLSDVVNDLWEEVMEE